MCLKQGLKVIVKRADSPQKHQIKPSLSLLFLVTVIAIRFWRENFLTAFGSGQPALCSGSRCLGGPLRGEREHFALIALARLVS